MLVLAAVAASLVASASSAHAVKRQVRVIAIHYRAHDGIRRRAYVLLPSWYGPKNDPAIPLVISPHGRGVSARANTKLWRGLPALGRFAVISPQGEGRKLGRYSWGARGPGEGLAPLPGVAPPTLPPLHGHQHPL